MPLTKSNGNMYPWVTHTHTHLAGECPHRCGYCYVQAIAKRFGHDRYTGPLRLGPDAEFSVRYGEGRVIFVEHCQDLWADSVPDAWVSAVLRHCNGYPRNEYVFQTKNPAEYRRWLAVMPPRRLLGCTIETDKDFVALAASPGAPPPTERITALAGLQGERLFITVEPVLRCDPVVLGTAIAGLRPEFVNVGADSKGAGLDEPSADDLRTLLDVLMTAGVEIRAKRNLGRILPNMPVRRSETAPGENAGLDAAIALGVQLGLLEINGNMIGLTAAGKQKAEEIFGPVPQNNRITESGE